MMAIRGRYGRLAFIVAAVLCLYLYSQRDDSSFRGSVLPWASEPRRPHRGEHLTQPPGRPSRPGRKAMPDKPRRNRSGRPVRKPAGDAVPDAERGGGDKARSAAVVVPTPKPKATFAPLPPPPGVRLPRTGDTDDPLVREFSSWRGPDYVPGPKPPRKQKPLAAAAAANQTSVAAASTSAAASAAPSAAAASTPVPDPFPLLSREDLRPSDPRLRPAGGAPRKHVDVETPLFIGFTRNWPQLLQCVVSYIAAGWPAEDIWVVENTGVMFANKEGRLTLQNPFYLNHTQLRMLGVNVVMTPTLLSFAQLQNYYAWTALERDWTEYFWSHQDLMVFSFENDTIASSLTSAPPPSSLSSSSSSSKPRPGVTPPASSLYLRAAAILRFLRQPNAPRWANHFFAYDHLTLVNRDAILAVGGWDTHIPYYATDCDMYDRLKWAGYWQGETAVGIVLDVASVLDDLGALLRLPGAHASFPGDPGPEGPDETLDDDEWDKAWWAIDAAEAARRAQVEKRGETWAHLVEVGVRMEDVKYGGGGGADRNRWQLRQSGGRGEPFYRDPEGFEIGLRMLIDTGRAVFAEKWGHRGCDIAEMGITAEDAWQLERDWDVMAEGWGADGDMW